MSMTVRICEVLLPVSLVPVPISEGPVLRSPVVLLVRHHVPDVDPLHVVAHRHRQPYLLPPMSKIVTPQPHRIKYRKLVRA
jgi:hypothetical protein